MNTELERMRVALFGHDGRNGFRGEMKKNQAVMEAKLEHIDKKLDEMIPRAVRIAAASLAGVSALAALVAAIIQAGGVI